MVPLVSVLFCTLWMSISSLTVSAKGTVPGNAVVADVGTEIGFCFFLTVMICWAVLVPAKIWSGRKGDSGLRRGVMTVLGVAVGLAALWMGGWILAPSGEPAVTQLARMIHDPGGNPPAGELVVAEPNVDPTRASLFQSSDDIYTAARYLTYFGLIFFAVRWWKMGDRHRSQRFSFAPILVVGFWALALLLLGLGPQPQGAVALVLAAAVVDSGSLRVVLGGVGPVPVAVSALDELEGIDPPGDLHASSRYRRALVKVLVERALEQAQ